MSEAAAAAAFNTRQIGYLPGVLGFDWVELRNGYALGRFEIAQQHLAPNGYLHAGSVVALADTACGYGCFMSLLKAPRTSPVPSSRRISSARRSRGA